MSKTLMVLRRLETRMEGVERSTVLLRDDVNTLREDMNTRFDTTNGILRDVRDLLRMGLLDRSRVDTLDRRVTALEQKRRGRRSPG